MYERAFDTDWDSLDKDELLERAYALGVDARFGNHHDDELEDLVAVARSNYDGSLIELAYAEGKQDARALSASDTDPETAWNELVEDGDVSIRGGADASDPDPTDAQGMPGALGRVDPGGSPDDGLDPVRLPEFLRRE